MICTHLPTALLSVLYAKEAALSNARKIPLTNKGERIMKTKSTMKKLVTLLTALAVLITSIAVYQPQTVEAAPKNGITLEQKYTSLYVGETYTLKAIAMYQNGTEMASVKKKHNTEKLSYKYFKFTSSNKKTATVSKKGVVTAKKKGNTTITMTSIYNSKIKTTIKLKVKAKKKAAITLSKKSATIGVGDTTQISVKKVKNISSKEMTFSTSDKKVATVSDKGVVTGKSTGTAKITVTSTLNKKAKTTFKVTVKSQDLLDTTVDPSGEARITLAETEVTLAPVSSFDGDSNSWFGAARWGAENKKSYGQAQIKIRSVSGLNNSAVTYKSSNTAVAEVSSTGFVTPKHAGLAVITVASKSNPEVKAEYKVTVKNLATFIHFQYIDKLRLEPDEHETPNADGYRVTCLGFEVYPKNADNRNFTVTSDNENIIKAETHYDEYGDSYDTLILKSKGKATLTIKSDDGYVTEKWTITVGDYDQFYVEGVSDPQP